MKTIIYFAGYKGHNSTKCKLFKEYFSDCNVIQFNQTFNLDNDIKTIDSLIAANPDECYFISSSLGTIPGLYAAFKYSKPIATINPCFFPFEVGNASNELSDKELSNLTALINAACDLKNNFPADKKLISIFLTKDDELINCSLQNKFKEFIGSLCKELDEEETGGHKYQILDQKYNAIEKALFE